MNASLLGILLTVQRRIYQISQLFTDARCFGYFFDAGTRQFLQTTKVREQVTTPFGAYTCYVFQCRSSARLATSGAMTGNGKAVRFVTYLLNQVQGWRIGRQGELMGSIIQVEQLKTGLARDALGYTEQ